jgi:hypothetical protein
VAAGCAVVLDVAHSEEHLERNGPLPQPVGDACRLRRGLADRCATRTFGSGTPGCGTPWGAAFAGRTCELLFRALPAAYGL